MNMYTNVDCIEMLDSVKGIFYVGCDFCTCGNSDEYEDEPLRINHSEVEEIKVVYNKKFNEYKNVVKTKNGDVYYIQL